MSRMAAHGARPLLPMVENATAVIGVELLARRRRDAISTARSLRAPRWRRFARPCAPRRRISTTTGYFHTRDIEAAIALVRSGAIIAAAGGDALPSICGSRHEPARLARCPEPRDAPLIVSLPHTGLELGAIETRLVSPWFAAQRRPTGRIERLYDFAGDLGATIVAHRDSRTVIDVNRDPSGASLYPGQRPPNFADHDLRRRAALL